MNIIYLDCFSGISGDMLLGALLDAGADAQYIQTELRKLPVDEYVLERKRVVKCGVSAEKINVNVSESSTPVHHRHYVDIVKMIQEADLDPIATDYALKIFNKIAIAEGKIHEIPIEKVHFHEVGAVDSIVDSVGVALALTTLKIDRIVSSPIPLGYGFVQCDHGMYPVPAPATLEMMKGVPVAHSLHRAELTTPTGASIVSALADGFLSSIPSMNIRAIGYGAGTRDLPNQPNVLRVLLGTISEIELERAMQREQLTFIKDDFKGPKAVKQAHRHSHDHDHSHNHSHQH